MYTREELIRHFKDAAEKFNRTTGKPNSAITRDFFRDITKIPYGNYALLWNTFADLRAEVFPDTKNNEERLAKLRTSCVGYAEKGQSRYIVTSVVDGANINKPFLRAIQNYCRIKKAKPVFLWSKGLYQHDRFTEEQLMELGQLYTSFTFSSKLVAMDLCIKPQQKDPLTGLDYLATGESSLIVASTKQAYRSLPRPTGKVPHSLWSTGTLSEPKYSDTACGTLAYAYNTLGALVVEVESATRFYIRPVMFIKDGFVDLGVKYTGDSAKPIACTGAILGDLHIPEEDPEFVAAAIDQINTLKAQNVFIHDLLSINSVNHHNLHEYLARAKMPMTNLKAELGLCKRKLMQYLKKIHKKASIFVVSSNHDAFITKWLNNGDFIKDTENARIGAEFFLKCLDGINPIESYLNLSRLRFLSSRQSKVVNGWECAFHGHAGSGGARGNLSNFAKTFSKVIIAHRHAPGINKGAIQVGTLSKLDLPYLTGGTTAWIPASAFIYADGSAQLITHIDRKWKL